MWKIIVLLLSILNLQLQAAAAAKPVEKEEKSAKQREVKTKQASALYIALDKALGDQLPKELQAITVEYAKETTAAEDMIHITEIALKKLGEIYELVRKNMPTREQLSLLSYGSGKEFDAGVRALREPILDALLHKVFTPERQEDAQRLIKSAQGVINQVQKQGEESFPVYRDLNRAGVPFPWPLHVRRLWEGGGFAFGPMIAKRSRMICNGCGAEVVFLHPWMQPQYYHKPGCKTLAQIVSDPRQAPFYPIVEYGQSIPEDDEEYWQYTMGFLVRYAQSKADAKFAAAKVVAPGSVATKFLIFLGILEQLPGLIMAAIFMENYDPKSSEEERKAQYKTLDIKPPFYEELRNLGAKKPKK
jgi:hypothetical protein